MRGPTLTPGLVKVDPSVTFDPDGFYRTDLDVEAVLTALRERVASYKVPRRVVVLPFEDVPATHSQKVDKRRLAALIEAASADQQTGSAPRGAV